MSPAPLTRRQLIQAGAASGAALALPGAGFSGLAPACTSGSFGIPAPAS